MLLKITSVLKKIVLNSFLIYAFNMIAIDFNINIPFNLWTIIFIGLFDIPGIAVLLTIMQVIGV